MKEIVFILSSLCDPHYRKRVEEFAENGYKVAVYGFKRQGQSIQNFPCEPVILGEIPNRGYFSRLALFYRSIKSIAKECRGKLCFYSSLDVALFARLHINSQYIYEVCDLTELVVGNQFIKSVLIKLNEHTIKKSALTIFTSEGFFDFYKKVPKEKIVLIPNKVSPHCPTPIDIDRTLVGKERIRIGYVGVIRFETIYNFIKICADKSDNIDIHLFGIYSNGDIYADKVKQLEVLKENIHYHGPFSNPADLPQIYSQIDLLLCTYTPSPGVIYAEPNKLYEAMYFKCPIIVSTDTFLGRKVEKMKIGYVVNAMDNKEIGEFLETLNAESYKEKVESCKKIDKQDCININTVLFETLENSLNNK
ncbi:MAG: glycosyltransferase family 4 protein [Rikenellaceae bacterium]|nr:glycosyltransferase family 4 protein [Rikenellaceae bacterium]